VQQPVTEVTALRLGKGVPFESQTALPPSSDLEVVLTRGEGQRGLRFSNAAGEEVIVGVSGTAPEVFVDRRRSSNAPSFHPEYPGRHSGRVRGNAPTIPLRVLFDRSVIEVFAGDGDAVVTDRVYPSHPLDRVELLAGSKTSGSRAVLWELQRAMP
jgi:sucrose-6-phosphate hydrolase SacC (GH32 family)